MRKATAHFLQSDEQKQLAKRQHNADLWRYAWSIGKKNKRRATATFLQSDEQKQLAKRHWCRQTDEYLRFFFLAHTTKTFLRSSSHHVALVLAHTTNKSEHKQLCILQASTHTCKPCLANHHCVLVRANYLCTDHHKKLYQEFCYTINVCGKH